MLSQTTSPVNITMDTAVSDKVMYTTSSWLSEDNDTQTLTPPEGCLVIPFSVSAPWDNPEDLISRKTQRIIGRFVNIYMLNGLFLVCLPTNLLNMVVFWKHGLRERINLCLFCLAFSDLTMVFLMFVTNLDSLYSEITGTPYMLVIKKFVINNNINLLAGFGYISGFLSTLIACERCLCVLSPLKARRMIQTRTTAIVIVTGHVIIMALYYVTTTELHVMCMFDPLTGQAKDDFYTTQFYRENKEFVSLFIGIVFGLLVPGLFVTIILIVTTATILKLRQMAEWRGQSSSADTSGGGSASRDVTLTWMLIGTSILFLACTSCRIVINTSVLSVPELSLSGKYYNIYFTLINVMQLVSYINSSVNFFIYYTFGTKFRHSVQSIFCKARLTAALQAKKRAKKRKAALFTMSRTRDGTPIFSNIADTE